MPRIKAIGSIDIETVMNTVPIWVEALHPLNFNIMYEAVLYIYEPGTKTYPIAIVSFLFCYIIYVPSLVNLVNYMFDRRWTYPILFDISWSDIIMLAVLNNPETDPRSQVAFGGS